MIIVPHLWDILFDFMALGCYITNRYMEKGQYEKDFQIFVGYVGNYLGRSIVQRGADKPYYWAGSGICKCMGINTGSVFNGSCD